MTHGQGCVACVNGGTIGAQHRADVPRGGCRQQWSHAGAAAPLRAMYRLAWGAVQRGLADALLGYAVAFWKRSRPRLLPAPPSRLEDDEDAFCGLHHRDCPCRTHPPMLPPLKVTLTPRRAPNPPFTLPGGGGTSTPLLFLVFSCARLARLPRSRHGTGDLETVA